MSVKLFKYILVITNLILIVLPIIGIASSYFFLVPRILTDLDNESKVQTLAFSAWGLVVILTSICFIGIALSRSVFLHLIAALLLCCPLALGVWIVVEQFLFRESPNWLVAAVATTASLIWAIQVLTELILACALCCSSAPAKEDAEAAPVEANIEKETVACEVLKTTDEDGTEEEKEKLVICAQQQEQQAFVPSPQAPPIQEVDEEPDEDEEEDDDEEDEPDSQAREQAQPNHPQELPLHTIREEERQQLLPAVGVQGHGPGQCPLATPEDTGV